MVQVLATFLNICILSIFVDLLMSIYFVTIKFENLDKNIEKNKIKTIWCTRGTNYNNALFKVAIVP